MKGFVYKVCCIIIFFIIIYPLKFVFFPYATTRVLLGIVGAPLLFKKRTFAILLNKKYPLFQTVIIISIISLASVLINGSTDLEYVRFPLTIFFIFSSCNLAINFATRIEKVLSCERICYYIIWAVNIQMFLAVLFFLSPAFKELMLSFLTSELQPLSLDRSGDLAFRLTGFGSQYVDAGMVQSAAAVIASFIIIRNNLKNCTFYVFSLVLIFIVGNALSRTTLIGYAVAFFYFIINAPQKNLKKVAKWTFFTTIALILIGSSALTLSEELEQQSRFAFEIFYNYLENGSMETDSSNSLIESWSIMPNNFHTWVIGDGRFSGTTNDSNYMGTDSGYFRLLFYFGLIGSLFYYKFHYYLCRMASLVTGAKALSFMLLIVFFILNLKVVCLYATFFGFFIFLPRKTDSFEVIQKKDNNCK